MSQLLIWFWPSRQRCRRLWRGEGGGRELMRLSLPLILSNSFWTMQIVMDRVFLSWYSSDAVGAAMAAVLIFWTPMALFQSTANYATTFVAQYSGANRPQRVGAAIWQSMYFSLGSGLAFFGLLIFGEQLVVWGGHSAEVQRLEWEYLRCLTFAALPTLIVASASSFFGGRGDSWTVLLINAVGLAVNVVLDYVLIFGYWGFPAMGIAGAGWATVAGASASAIVALALLWRQQFRAEFATLSAWRWDRDLFGRLLRFGLPSGLQTALDVLAFTVFLFLVGRFGAAELAATSIAFTINMAAFMPTLGISQGIMILVGQRLGQDRPDLAERTTWTGFGLAWCYMTIMALLYLCLPGLFLALFQGEHDRHAASLAEFVPVLLRFVAIYSLFDSMSLVFAFALKGAGDTRFVTVVSLLMSWPIMVLPTWATWYYDWGLYWAWGFASAYIILLGFVFLLRFWLGPWRGMRVIEAAPAVTG